MSIWTTCGGLCERFWRYLKAQIKDPGTWRGLVLTYTGLRGWERTTVEDQVMIFTFIGLTLVGIIDVISPPDERYREAGDKDADRELRS